MSRKFFVYSLIAVLVLAILGSSLITAAAAPAPVPALDATCNWQAAPNSAAYQACLVTSQATNTLAAPAASNTPKPTHDSNGPDNGHGLQTQIASQATSSAVGSPTPTALVIQSATPTKPGLHLGWTPIVPGTHGRSTWTWVHPRRGHR